MRDDHNIDVRRGHTAWQTVGEVRLLVVDMKTHVDENSSDAVPFEVLEQEERPGHCSGRAEHVKLNQRLAGSRDPLQLFLIHGHLLLALLG